jgi:hypothetical protein
VDRDRAVSEEEIQRAFDEAKPVRLRPGSRILLVQSGAVFPDGPMLEALKQDFDVTPFSGVPPRRTAETDPASSYSKSLRLAAARAGCETVVCYWGALESGRRKMETKTLSWVPIVGWVVPDESQHMRLRLKLALVDVRTGQWRLHCPEPIEDKAWSTRFTRDSSDQSRSSPSNAWLTRHACGNCGSRTNIELLNRDARTEICAPKSAYRSSTATT